MENKRNGRRIELRHLRYFVMTAEEGVVTRAAERLGIQQPPLSQQLKVLEEEVGVTLFNRSTRGVELTTAGQSMLNGAHTVLEMLDQTVERTRRVGAGEVGNISVGYTSSTLFHNSVSAAIRRFKEQHPAIHIELEEGCTSDLLKLLEERRTDVAFVRAPSQKLVDLSLTTLAEEEMVLAVPHGHELASARGVRPVRLANLSEEKFILYRRTTGPGLYDTIIAACAEAGISPRIGQEAPRMFTALNLVAAGFGISIVPRSMRTLEAGAVRFLDFDVEERIVAPIHLAYRKNSLSPAAVVFSEYLEAFMERHRSKPS